jgi:hypothetical protein
MKPSPQTLSELDQIKSMRTKADIRRLVSIQMMALARKEVSHEDMSAMADGCNAISQSLNVELKIIRTQIELREFASNLGKVEQLGQLLIGNTKETT